MANKTNEEKIEAKNANRDPITGAPGSHPVGTGVGAAAAGTAGAAIGAMAGPVGALAGAVIGSAIGAAAGHGIGEAVDPTVEGSYWRENYSKRDYAKGETFETYEPAYRYGWESVSRYDARPFEEVEPELEEGWGDYRGESNLDWGRARPASEDAYNRIKMSERYNR